MSNSINNNLVKKFFYAKVKRDFFVKNYEFICNANMGFYTNIPLDRFILIEKHNIEYVKAITQLENNN